MTHLEKFADPSSFLIIDAIFFYKVTFGGVAKYMMTKQITNTWTHTIHFVIDKWLKLSIKDSERERGGGGGERRQRGY